MVMLQRFEGPQLRVAYSIDLTIIDPIYLNIVRYEQ